MLRTVHVNVLFFWYDQAMEYNVPFFSNTPDDTHCVQASLRMILKYFEPAEDYTWEELEVITGKNDAYWTWPLAMLLWLSEKSYDVRVKDLFDYDQFVAKGGQYIIDEMGEEVGNAQIKNSDIALEQERARLVADRISKVTELPTNIDIMNYLDDGYLVLCRVNSLALNGKKGYMGHSIVVKGFDDDGFIINDPGLPAMKNRRVDLQSFEKGWAYPNVYARNLTAIKPS